MVDMRALLNLVKTKARLVAIVAGILVAGYICLLVSINYFSQVKLRESTLEQLRQDMKKSAMAVNYFCSERKNDLKNLAESRAISAFFENKALGMSMEYGLRSSLLGIFETFSYLLANRKLGKDRIYTRIVFIDTHGKLLVDSQPKREKGKHELDWKTFLYPGKLGAAIIELHERGLLKVMVSIPYFFKNQYVGQILAWISPKTVYHFVEAKGSSMRSVYIVCTKHLLPLPADMQDKPDLSTMTDLGNAKIVKTYQFERVKKDGSRVDMIAMGIQVKDTPLSLIMLLPATEVFGRTAPWYLPLTMGGLAIIILAGMAVAFRINAQRLVLDTRLEEASKRKQEIEETNQQLEKEISIRERAEQSLLKAHDDLEIRIEKRTRELAESNVFLKREIEERKRAEQALRESEEKFRSIVENSHAGIFTVDKDYRFTYANKQLCEILGYPLDEIVGRDFRGFLDEESKLLVAERYRQRQKGKKIPPKYEFNVARKDGQKKRIEIISTVIMNPDRMPQTISQILDITEQKQLESQLQRAQKMEAIGTLAGGVAHDLNDVLSGIITYPELLLMDMPEDSPLRDPILNIQRSGEKAAAIVQNMLTLARRGVSIKDVVDLNNIIFEYLDSPEYQNLRSFYPDAKLKTNLETDLLNIMGSPINLSKTIMNLVSNAAEAMSDGGKFVISTQNQYIDKPITGYETIKDGDYVILSISDTGIGISPDDIEKIFEPFYTKKKMGRSGTGLGMAVVWGTVKDHNGYINVQSIEGKGTTFTLYFPATRKEPAKNESKLSVENYMGNGEKVLIVDDVEEQRKIASHILKKLNYSIAAVSSGEEAVEYMKSNSADLLVLDMIMDPGIDGLDTYKQILKFQPKQKAIIASGFSETDRVREAQRFGAGAYVRKPYMLEKIGLAVKAELNKRDFSPI